MIIIKNRMKLSRLLLNKHIKKTLSAKKWDELPLAEPEKAMLRQVIIEARDRKTGLVLLFSGPSGTGKTIAAEIIAEQLQRHLFRVDLGLLVSKYIGETEKNLNRVFDTAESSHPVLLFDEADALCCKRSDVSYSHDRYTSIAMRYLLQRMEAYSGLMILSTSSETMLETEFQKLLYTKLRFD